MSKSRKFSRLLDCGGSFTLCDPVDCSPPGSPIHGISQARVLEWVAIPFSRGSSWLRNWNCILCSGRQTLYHRVTWEVPLGSWSDLGEVMLILFFGLFFRLRNQARSLQCSMARYWNQLIYFILMSKFYIKSKRQHHNWKSSRRNKYYNLKY